MKPSRNKIFFAVALFVALGTVSALQAPVDFQDTVGPSDTQAVQNGEPVLYTGKVTTTVHRDTDGDGEREVVYQESSPNIVVTQGEQFITFAMSGVGAPNGEVAETDDAIYIGVRAGDKGDGGCNDATHTFLCGASTAEENSGGLTRTQGTTIDLNGDAGNYSVWNTFTATTSVNAVNATGLFWNNSVGTPALVAENTFQSVDLLADDQLTVNWTEVSVNQ